MRKYLSVLTALALLLAFSFGGVEKSYAQSSQANDDQFSTEDLEVAKVIEEHLAFDQITNTLTIVDEEGLESSLKKISSNVSLADVKKDINNANDVMKENNGNNAMQKASACEIGLGVLGLWHGVQFEAAMLILGVATTPALLAITAVTGAIWVGGALMCP